MGEVHQPPGIAGRRRMQNNWITITCMECGVPYRTIDWKSRKHWKQVFCSLPCKAKKKKEGGLKSVHRAGGLTKKQRRILRAQNRKKIRKERGASVNFKRYSQSKKSNDFYLSGAWRVLRYEVLKKYGNSCMSCGISCRGKQLHIDHIKPRAVFPELSLDINNLQVLCADCNIGKGAWDMTDFREKETPNA